MTTLLASLLSLETVLLGTMTGYAWALRDQIKRRPGRHELRARLAQALRERDAAWDHAQRVEDTAVEMLCTDVQIGDSA